MFLKLRQESFSYHLLVQSEEDKDRYIVDYRFAEGIALYIHFQRKVVQEHLTKIKLNSMWGRGHRTKT